MDLNLYMIELL